MSAPLLELRGLRKWFPIRRGVFSRTVGHLRAVEDVSFSIGSREVLGLAGESGSGKTTIGRSILRLIEPTAGEVLFKGEDVTKFDRGRLRAFRRQAQIVFQDPMGALNPRLTIADILAEPLILQNAVERSRRRDRIVELLEMVALSADYLERRPHELSGGQKQRIVIARALAVDPTFVVADEPVSALDVSIQAQIIVLLKDLKERLQLSMLFISHDLAVMEYLSDRIAVLYLGRLMEIGPAAAVCGTPAHPYTRALLSAVPSQDPKQRRERILLAGDLPNPADPPSGCVFRTRCPWAIAACAGAAPALKPMGAGHYAACIRAEELAGTDVAAANGKMPSKRQQPETSNI